MIFNYKNILFLLVALQIFLVLLFLLSDNSYMLVTGVDTSDGPSYINYPWHSLHEILGSHRGFGYPLFLKAIFFFTGSYKYVPLTQILLYFFSAFVLYFSFSTYLPKYRLSSFVFCCFLIWYIPIFQYFPHILSESNAASILNLCLALSIIAYKKNSKLWYILLLIFSFLLFQTRTALVYACFLFPFWILFLGFLEKKNKKDLLINFKNFFLVSTLPVFVFIFLRFLMVGHIGIVPLNGILLSGHATFYHTADDSISYKGKLKDLDNLLQFRKQKLDPPCNEFYVPSLVNYPEKTHSLCYGPFVMMNWLAAIDILDDDRPFDDHRLYNAWRHTKTLSGFFSRYTVEHDKLLMEYSVPILKLHKQEYLKWITSSLKKVPDIISDLPFLSNLSFFENSPLFLKNTSNLTILFLSAILFSIFLMFFKRLITQEESLFFIFVGLSFLSLSLFPVVLMNKLFTRFFDLNAIYLFPSIFIIFVFGIQQSIVKLRNLFLKIKL